MRSRAAGALGRRQPAILALLLAAVFAALSMASAEAQAKTRHALVVGIGTYKKASGLKRLRAPVHDASAVKDALLGLRQNFRVTMLTDKELPDRAAFEAAMAAFLQEVKPGDEVLFYFSGHGNHLPGAGNVFLLPSAKSEAAYIKDLSVAEARELESSGQRTKKYQEWLATVALVEAEIERAILAKAPDVLIIVADACRTLIDGTKGAAALIGGIQLPQQTARGTYRLYSAGIGQISLDSPEPIVTKEKVADKSGGVRKDRKAKDDDDDEDESPRSQKRTNSLFTKVLLSKIGIPGLDFEIMAVEIKRTVRHHAAKLGAAQIPDYVTNRDSSEFFFTLFDARDQREEICKSAATEIARLRSALAAGSLGREVLENKRVELSRCGSDVAGEIEALLRLEARGAGALAAGNVAKAREFDANDPAQLCEGVATSPHDQHRTRDVADDHLQQLTLAALSGEEDRALIVAQLEKVLKACEGVLVERPRVARYYYLTGRVYQTTAAVTLDRAQKESSLAAASGYFQRASDLGYAAAFNDLAMMYKDGEYFAIKGTTAERRPPDRSKALELLQRGATQNHTIALYNLGMAYLNGDLGVRLDNAGAALEDQAVRYAKAFEHLSKAAERAYVPALIETAKLLYWGRGVPENEKRAVDLLQIAASRGSWEAMYWIGFFYKQGNQKDLSRAIIWFARAAEAGDARAQEELALMMTAGEGLPASQPEAAGRYWRLAAEAGRRFPQGRLADLIRDGIIPFRPVLSGRPDRGAGEIKQLYLSALAGGNPRAGLQLAKLYRTGFPKDEPSTAIPRSPDYAVRYLWETIEKVNQADPDTQDADPKVRAWAAFELMSIHDQEASGGIGRSSSVTEDQIRQLRSDFGDGSKYHWISLKALRPEVRCGNARFSDVDQWIMVWNWSRPEPPTEAQFDWLERRYRCAEEEQRSAKIAGRDAPSSDNIGFTRKLRNSVLEEHKAWLKEAGKSGAKSRTFIDRMVERVNKK